MGRSLAAAACLATLSCGGCLMNGARDITLERGAPSRGAAVIVVGIRNETGKPVFGFRFDQYSLKTQRITMNCFIDNHFTAGPSGPGETRFFAFVAPTGDYVASPYSSGPKGEGGSKTWRADRGEASYFGTFTGTPDDGVKLENALAEAQAFADRRGLGKLVPAEVTPIAHPPFMLLCGP